MVKEFWDFNEIDNYSIINLNNNKYHVLNKYSDKYIAVQILDYLNYIINLMCIYLQKYYTKYTNTEQIAIKCFLDIHCNKCQLSEMQLNTPFDGLNKPRNVYKSNKEKLGSDKHLRAKYRHVFLTLRNENGSFRHIDSIMNLTLHEIAHTMCNHVTWTDDNHKKDFIKYEKILTNVYNRIPSSLKL